MEEIYNSFRTIDFFPPGGLILWTLQLFIFGFLTLINFCFSSHKFSIYFDVTCFLTNLGMSCYIKCDITYQLESMHDWRCKKALSRQHTVQDPAT